LHHLYGILERPPLASRLPDAGVDDRPVLVRRLGGFVVVSTLVEATPHPTSAALKRHHDVLASITVPGPVFPLRYGVSVPVGGLETWLAIRAGGIRAAFHGLRGRVEMRVSVLSLHFGTGDVDGLQAVADRVATAAGVANWRGRLSGKGGNAAVVLAFLVPRVDVSTFLSRIAPIASRAGDVAVVPSGPWPPFTFVPALDLPTPALEEPAAMPHAV
jgi:Gas vesicle synthesis protein GvpL/GvpF